MEHLMYHFEDFFYVADTLLPQKLKHLNVNLSSPTSVNPDSQLHFDQLELAETSTKAAIDTFSRYNDVVLPACLTRCIRESYNVTGDGHCGFRSISFFMFGREDKWAKVRSDLLHEMNTHADQYTNVLGLPNFNKQREKVNYFEEFTDEKHHLEIDALGFVVATLYQRIVVVLSTFGCLTFLPLWLTSSSSLSSITNAEKVIMLLKGNHFYAVRMDDDTPLPTLHPSWNTYRDDKLAPLKDHYTEYFEKFSMSTSK